jgi:hypothetical protein
MCTTINRTIAAGAAAVVAIVIQCWWCPDAKAQYAKCSELAVVPLAALGGLEGLYSPQTRTFAFAVAPELTGGAGFGCYDTHNDSAGPWTIPITVSTGAAFMPSTMGSFASDPKLAGQTVYQTFSVYTGFLWTLLGPDNWADVPVGLVIGYQWLYASPGYAKLAGSGVSLMFNFPIQFKIPHSE